MSLPVTVVVLNLRDIFHFFLDGAGINTYLLKVRREDGPEEGMCWMWKQIIFQLAIFSKRES